jgi:hypothetical protein
MEKYTKKELENIRSRVIQQIEEDINSDDFTSLYELLSFVPTENLLAYLPE